MTLLLTDNEELLQRFISLLKKKGLEANQFHFAFSPVNKAMMEKYSGQDWIKPVNVKENVEAIISNYTLVLSLHSKQLFPAKLVESVTCINIHPGLNPHNRGWFPQVFSIINKKPAGATIHLMDEQLDHGPVIAQKEITVEDWDTSFSAYNKVLDAEIELLDENLENILKGGYQTFSVDEGNVNLKKDFDKLCRLNLNSPGTLGEHIDLLRALTHGDYANAWFMNEKGEKIFIKVSMFKGEGK